MILVYLIYILMSFLYDKSNVTIAFKCLIVVLTFIKVIFFLRIFEKLSFLVQMVTSVFSDLRWFMLFFSVFISTFAVLINIVFNAHQEMYDNIGAGIMFFIIAFRTSVGDYSFDDFPTADYYEIELVVWFFIMIVGNMVFMNFIIAVVNQSYEQCMSKMVVLQFKVKVDMIVERESMMREKEL
jgi:Polycystin cation channel